MIKDLGYFMGLNLAKLAARVAGDKTTRKELDVFSDMITAVVLRCEREVMTGEDLQRYLGDPDTVTKRGLGEVWEYVWVGCHDSRKFTSSTSFIIQGDRAFLFDKRNQAIFTSHKGEERGRGDADRL
jgi:hypothetical protein